MLNNNYYYLLTNTPLTYPLPLTEEEGLKYLQFLNKPNFLYNNISNFDIIDYEKLIYIENTFKQNETIQNIIKEIKNNIANGYQIRNQYKNRIFDFTDIPEERVFEYNEKKYFGLPRTL